MNERPGYARFLYPQGIQTEGPWFTCSSTSAEAIRKWAGKSGIEWREGTTRPG